ncbi:MAG: Maf family nucleotide pyrophosphatase [bacterium]|nr:Maf family nucleotide pyrophosphatase [bacterium]
MKIILGSTSPYKKQLLEEAGFEFVIEDSGLNEEKHHQDTVRDTVQVLAELKAKKILKKHPSEDAIIITTDVAGELDGNFLGKPKSVEEAIKMIMSYSGREVLIWCGTSIANARTREIKTQVVKATVHFNHLEQTTIIDYVHDKNPLDKGCAIAIEEIEGRGFVKEITGEYAAIIGISMQFVFQQLYELGYEPPEL